jgi:hypothetical protein
VKINGDKASAGFPIEKNDKPSRMPSKSGAGELARLMDTADDLELTGNGKAAAVFNALRESNVDASNSLTDELDTIREKLSALTGRLLSSPQQALSAQANLDSETVSRLVS